MSAQPTTLKRTHEPGLYTPVEVVDRAYKPASPATLDFCQRVRGMVKELRRENHERNIQLYRRGVRNQKTYEGDHYGGFHPYTSEWIPRPVKLNDPFYPHNKTRYYSDAVTADTLQSRFDLRVLPASDDDKNVWAAKGAKHIVDYYEERIFTSEFLIDEDKQRQFFGQVFFLTDWNTKAGPIIDVPQYERRQEMSPEGYECLSCGATGTIDDLAQIAEIDPMATPACLSCGSPELEYSEPEAFEYDEIVDYSKHYAGEPRTIVVPFVQVDFDRSSNSFDLATWVIRRRRVPAEIIERDFSWWSYQGAGSDSDTDNIAQDTLEESTGNTGRRDTRRAARNDRRPVVEQCWLKPERYWRERVADDVELAGGDVIPRGAYWREFYPDGMYVMLVGDEPIDFSGEDFLKVWVHLKYKHIPNRADGDGIEDIVRPQQEYNKTRSMLVAHVEREACKPTFIRDPIKESSYTGKPGEVTHVKGMRHEIPLSNLVFQSPPSPLGREALMLNEQADREMQGAVAAFSTATGAPDIADAGGAETARGMELITGQAAKMRGPELALRAEAYAKVATQWLEHFKENAELERYMPLRNKTGLTEGRYLSKSDVDGDFTVKVKKGSWVPKDEARRRADLLGALEAGAANPQLPYEWRQEILDRFGIDMELDEFLLDIRAAMETIEQLEEMAPQAAQMAGGLPPSQGSPGSPQVDPMTGQMMPPPSPEQIVAELLLQMIPLDELDMEAAEYPVRISYFRKWAKEDNGRRADPAVRMAVALLIRQYKQQMAMSMAQDQMLAMQANGPQIAMAEGQQNQQSQRDEKMKAQDRDHQMMQDEKRMAHEKEVAGMKVAAQAAARR